MLTNTPDTKAGDGVWFSVSDLAKEKGVTRQSMSERVKRLEALGKLEVRKNGNRKLVNLATFDRAVGEEGDPAKELAADSAPFKDDASVEYKAAQTRKANLAAEMSALDVAERRGKIVPIEGEHGVLAAAEAVAGKILSALDILDRFAPDYASAVGKEGERGARRVSKQAKREIREEMHKALLGLVDVGDVVSKDAPAEINIPGLMNHEN